ncbi:MAG: cytochrome C6 [Leptolyngbya sp. DLM2.Bin15]|nr:MAG: cytochrome C6 [Leptolyngbya sp. DLM2.Bin15]
MKRVIISLLITVCLGLFAVTPSALAADIANGAKVFGANCAACHMGGGNVVNSAKTLRKSDLEQYNMASLEAIQVQIQRGKAAMPSFLGRLTPEQIEDVATYVLDQAEKGW